MATLGTHCSGYAHTPKQGNTTTRKMIKLLHKQVKPGEIRSHALALAVALGHRLVLELLARDLVRGRGKCRRRSRFLDPTVENIGFLERRDGCPVVVPVCPVPRRPCGVCSSYVLCLMFNILRDPYRVPPARRPELKEHSTRKNTLTRPSQT